MDRKNNLKKLDREKNAETLKEQKKQAIKAAIIARDDIRVTVATDGWKAIISAIENRKAGLTNQALRGQTNEQREVARLTLLAIEQLEAMIDATIKYEAPKE
jgi:hypothetical protein